MELSFLFRYLNAIKYLHWTTKVYAEHIALDSAYSSLSEHIDKFVEVYRGLKPEEKLELKNISFNENPKPQDYDNTLDFFKDLSHDFLNKIEKYNEQSSLESIIDDMENVIYQTLYLLGLE